MLCCGVTLGDEHRRAAPPHAVRRLSQLRRVPKVQGRVEEASRMCSLCPVPCVLFCPLAFYSTVPGRPLEQTGVVLCFSFPFFLALSYGAGRDHRALERETITDVVALLSVVFSSRSSYWFRLGLYCSRVAKHSKTFAFRWPIIRYFVLAPLCGP